MQLEMLSLFGEDNFLNCWAHMRGYIVKILHKIEPEFKDKMDDIDVLQLRLK